MPLRREILRTTLPDGRVELHDPLLQRSLTLSADEAGQVSDSAEPVGELRDRLAAALLLEGPAAVAVRAQVLAARRADPPLPPPDPAPPEVDWLGLSLHLPGTVSERWRDPEELRRLAEDRVAGRRVLTLRGWWSEPQCPALVEDARRAARDRLDTDIVHGWRGTGRHVGGAFRATLEHPAVRVCLGALLGVRLDGAVHLNAWRLRPGDHLAVHPDGPRYRATAALGLNPGWRHHHGGAIAFGMPRQDGGFDVHERWLPHAGDLCLFVPSATTWHVVEPPRRERLSLSGWWLAPDGPRPAGG